MLKIEKRMTRKEDVIKVIIIRKKKRFQNKVRTLNQYKIKERV